MRKWILAMALGMVLVFSGVGSAEMLIYPAKGQSPEQQKKDEYECHQWAVKKTGYDPTKASSTPSYEESKSGGAVKGGLGGALVGAGVGALFGNTGKGAAIGAGAGAVGGGLRQRRKNKQANERNRQAQDEVRRKLEEYNQAKALCLEGRGYKVQVK